MTTTTPAGEPVYPLDNFRVAVNKAADEILELAPSDDRLRDALNLLVNASLSYVDAASDAQTLADVVKANYLDATLDDVKEWITGD